MKKWLIFVVIFAVILLTYMMIRGASNAYDEYSGEVQESVEPPSRYLLWQEFEAPSGMFTLTFPGVPQYITEVERDDIGLIERTNEIYVSETESGSIYVLNFIRFHTDDNELPLPVEKLLNNVMHEMIDARDGNRLSGFKKREFLGKEALEYAIKNGNIHMEVLTFVENNDLYVLSEISDHSNYTEADFDHFINSFRFNY
ncbi:hypothetical protein N9Y92_02840 [Chlamydiales bacterium]|nr:hypothetical protein [Chlamydiales bacterium]